MRRKIVIILPGLTGIFPLIWKKNMDHYEYPHELKTIFKNGTLSKTAVTNFSGNIMWRLNLLDPNSRRGLLFTALFSDNAPIKKIGSHLGLACFSRAQATSDLSQLMQNHHNIIIIEDKLINELASADFSKWSSSLQHINEHVITPCLAAIKLNYIDELVLDDGLGLSFQYTKGFKIFLRKNSFGLTFK
ncbi:hypothetical protein AwWohl_08950 [Gammaproteobacteria bacterium]|nr:hypothetical protein AwWohl_08950 [Gammaproteobacteria bacterium]